MEASQKEMNLLTSNKNVQDLQALLVAQAELVAEYNGKLMAVVQLYRRDP
jgi:hypothetical protein